MKLSLKARLLRYLQAHPGFIAKGTLCDLAREHCKATGEHTGRRLRELENEKLVEVEYRKGHAWYRAADVMSAREMVDWFDRLPSKV